MKLNNYNFIKILPLLLIMIACNDDFLDEKPRSFLSPDVTYDSDGGLVTGAVGLYDELGHPYFSSTPWRDCWVLTNGATDFNMMGLQKEREEVATLRNDFGPSTSESTLMRLWSHYYRLANNATTILDNSEENDWSNENLKKRTEGEASFFRGWAHFYLAMLWGDIPPIRSEVKGVKLDFVQEPQMDVINYAIEDFTKAVESLPEQPDQPGRVTKATAMHMLAYAYLASKDYVNAEKWAQNAIDDPNYELVTERFGGKADVQNGNFFWDLFQLDNQNDNPEGLLVVQNGNAELRPQISPAVFGNRFRGPRALIPRYERVDGLHSSPQYGGRGYGWNSPTMGYYDLFEPEDIRGKMPVLQTIWTANEDKGDISIGDTLFVFGNPEKSLYPQDDIRLRPFPTKWNKEYDPNDPTKETPHPDEMAYTGGSIRDFYLIRLSETYLILAEAQHMQGKDDLAAQNINLVRTRSGASAINAGDVSVDFILDEKARELWGELYSRKVELFRTGKYVERVKKYNPEAGLNVQEKHTLLPIPQIEIDLNTEVEIQQNPGY